MKYSLIAGLTFYTITSQSIASPWPQPEGGLLVISKTEGFQSDGSENRTFRQASTSTYIEFGLTRNLTAGANISYAGQWFSGDTPSAGSGFNTREVFLQRSLPSASDTVLAARLTYAAPARFTRQSARLGRTEETTDAALEAAFLAGRNFGPDLKRFVSLEAGYRPSLGADADFFRADVTLGYKPDEHWLLMVKSLNRMGVNGTTASALDYDSFRLEPSLAFRRKSGRTYELGLSADLGGRNIEQGVGVFFSIWNRF